jgi:hypothetical protein
MFLWIMWIGDSLDALDPWQNCVEVMSLYKAPDDAYVTGRALRRENPHLVRNRAAVKP